MRRIHVSKTLVKNITVLTTVFVSSFTLALAPLIAHATSAWDGAIIPLSTLTATNTSCGDLDLSTHYADIFTDDAAWVAGYGGSGAAFQAAWGADYDTALSNGTNWAVVERSAAYASDNGLSGSNAITITWTSSSGYVSYGTDGLGHYGFGWVAGPSTDSSYRSLSFRMNNDCTSMTVFDLQNRTESVATQIANGRALAYTPSDDFAPTGQFFVNTSFFETPSGYDGETPPPLPDIRAKVFPLVAYNVDQNGNLQASYLDPDSTQQPIGLCRYDVLWTLTNVTDSMVVGTYRGAFSDLFTWRSLPHKDYTITAEYQDTIPCPLLADVDGVNSIPVTLPFTFAGGAIVSGTGTQCDNDGVCSDIPSLFCDITDPSTYPNCLTNAWNQLLFFLGISYGFQNGAIITTFEPHDNVLQSIIIVPLDLVSHLADGTYSCSPVDFPLPTKLGGGNLTAPCMQSDVYSRFGYIFTLYQTVVSGVIVYYIFVKMLAFVKATISSKDEGKIEVLQL